MKKSRRDKECLQETTYDSSVHPPQFCNVPTDDIAWTGYRKSTGNSSERGPGLGLHDTPDELNHPIGNSAESPDEENLERFVGLGCG